MQGGRLVQIAYDHPGFVDDTLWVDVNRNGRKDPDEYVFGTYYRNTIIPLEEETWVDLNNDGNVDPGEFVDVNMDGIFTRRDVAAFGYKFPEFNDLNGNGRYDVGEPGEPFLDLNGNGYYDFPNGTRDEWEPYIDHNAN
jgi:uncharacterized protein YuzE